MLRIIMILALAGALASAAHAQNVPPASNAAARTAPATATAAPAPKADARPATKGGKSTSDARPAYNINEGPNKVGPFAGGAQQLRAQKE